MTPSDALSTVDDLAGAENAQDELLCPACGARQQSAESCRRCQCDLRLVCEMRQQLRRLRMRCLALVRQRRLRRALKVAQQCVELCPGEQSMRLLAVCHLLAGDFASASHAWRSLENPSA